MVAQGLWRGAVVAPLLFALTAIQAYPEDRDLDPKEALQSLLSNALQITVAARVLPSDEKPIWNAESTKVTLPGRSIRVRMDGENVRIYLICTPYVQDNGEVLLLAQGQVWFTTPPDNELKYLSTFSSIPVSFGEKVLFFPLGISDKEAKQKGFVNVEVEIKIVPYSSVKSQAQQDQPQQ
ncbi:MAG TPA: hypothetical protein VL354_11680 [Spirochaetia bacterium]|nr:hypothetical protein [Spirochaetia bacterium]